MDVPLHFSDSGCPLFVPADGSTLRVSAHEGAAGSDKGEMRQIVIEGNREGLISLASALLSLASSNDSGHHLHLDDVYGGVVDSPQGYVLTVQRMTR